MTLKPRSRSRAAAAVAAAVLLFTQPRPARADGSITYEYEDYRELGGRIDVHSQGTQAEQDLSPDLHLMVGGTIDSIAGATPDGQRAPPGSDQVVLSEITDHRKAWNADLSAQISNVNVSAGFARSLESDYVSNGWSLNTLTTFNQKNTTLLVGASGTDDNVEVRFVPGWQMKRSHDIIVGVTQLLDPLTSVSLDLTGSRFTGFLNEPYRLVQKQIEILPGLSLPETFAENRPNFRDRGTAFLSVDRAFPRLRGSLEASYRFYRDTYGITANTVDAAWFQKIGREVILSPDLRYYEQSAANFYYYDLDNTPIIPTRIPNSAGPNYSSDARLSAFYSTDAGLKAIWNPSDWLQLIASIDTYAQRGTDGVTPQSAYYRARITSISAKISW